MKIEPYVIKINLYILYCCCSLTFKYRRARVESSRVMLLFIFLLLSSGEAQVCTGDRDCTFERFCINGRCEINLCTERLPVCRPRIDDTIRDPLGCIKYVCTFFAQGTCYGQNCTPCSGPECTLCNVYNCSADGLLCNVDPDGDCLNCANDRQCPQYDPANPCTLGVCNKPNVNTRCIFKRCQDVGLFCAPDAGCSSVERPTRNPTPSPTSLPTNIPTRQPTTPQPTPQPTNVPLGSPTLSPTREPSRTPTTDSPTLPTRSPPPSSRFPTSIVTPSPTDENNNNNDESGLSTLETGVLVAVIIVAILVLFFFIGTVLLRHRAKRYV